MLGVWAEADLLEGIMLYKYSFCLKPLWSVHPHFTASFGGVTFLVVGTTPRQVIEDDAYSKREPSSVLQEGSCAGSFPSGVSETLQLEADECGAWWMHSETLYLTYMAVGNPKPGSKRERRREREKKSVLIEKV